jgi:hypothetical protein
MIKIVHDSDFPYKKTNRSKDNIVVNVEFVECQCCKEHFYDFDRQLICKSCLWDKKTQKNPSSGVA